MEDEQLFSKILVPTDSSASAVIAEELRAYLAKKLDSKVTIFYVVSHELMRPEYRKFFGERHQHVPVGAYQESPAYLHTEPAPEPLPESVVNEITEAYRKKADEVMSEAATAFKSAGIIVDQKTVHHSDPAEAIVKEAKQGKYDIIVMGHDKKTEFLLRGVAEKVSRHAETPVLVAKGTATVSSILVAIDGSEISTKALRYATHLAKKVNAKMTLLHVQEEGLLKAKPEVGKKIGESVLSAMADKVKGMKIDTQLKTGDPANVIVEVAKKGKHDIIVIGSKGHSAIERFLLGSVSNHVIHYADRSVLLVR